MSAWRAGRRAELLRNPTATERSGSRVSIFGGFRHSVSRATICPLGQPNKAIGHESQIEPWLAIANPLLAGAKEAELKNAKEYDSENSHGSGKENPCFGEKCCSRQQGLDVRKISSPGGSDEVFFLDIPFYRTRPASNVPTGLRAYLPDFIPTLKRGANKRSASGARRGLFRLRS